MKSIGLVIVSAAIMAFWMNAASAECICQCVNGHMQPLCQNAIDLPPICPPTICPIMSPSIAPINPPTIPPIGTSGVADPRLIPFATSQKIPKNFKILSECRGSFESVFVP